VQNQARTAGGGLAHDRRGGKKQAGNKIQFHGETFVNKAAECLMNTKTRRHALYYFAFLQGSP
jgi:hypothetical protein